MTLDKSFKPNAAFFEMGTALLKATTDELIMVGDDLINDIEGAQNAGYHAVLVQTGKYRKAFVAQSQIKPDGIISSIAALPSYLSSLIKQ